jgi:DNA topoisomerase III
MKVLSVAEKPSVAKELASIIGGGNARRVSPLSREFLFTRTSSQRNGHSHFNHIFDIDNCQVKGQTASMSITSVLGHLMELEFDESYQKWSSCLPEQLFTAPIKKEVPSSSSLLIPHSKTNQVGSKMLNLKKTLAEVSHS